jgi:hypothetical protein
MDGPERRAGKRHLGLGHRPRDTEIDDLDSTVSADQDVARLDVAMDDAARVGGGQRACHRPGDPGRLGRWQ